MLVESLKGLRESWGHPPKVFLGSTICSELPTSPPTSFPTVRPRRGEHFGAGRDGYLLECRDFLFEKCLGIFRPVARNWKQQAHDSAGLDCRPTPSLPLEVPQSHVVTIR